MTGGSTRRFSHAPEGVPGSPWFLGIARIGVLGLVACGIYVVGLRRGLPVSALLGFYVFGLVAYGMYLVAVRRAQKVPPLLVAAQVLVDFGVVAATISFTGGPESFFNFLFVIVILEAGLLLGVYHSFLFATLAAVALLAQTLAPPVEGAPRDTAVLWYNYVVQALAFYLTASISGYWNQRVRRIQQFQHEILDNLNNGFLIADGSGTILAVNKAAEAILGLEPGEALGRPVEEILRVPSGGECPLITALRLQRDFTSYEFNAETASGEFKILGLTTSRIHDSRGRLTSIIASFSDLTEMANLRLELQRQDRLAVVGELAAGLAHEIRNPVAAIRGAVDELQHNLDVKPMAERLAAIAIRESDQLNQIVSGFLDFARKPSLKPFTFDVRGLVSEVLDGLEYKHPTNGRLRIEGRLAEGLCPVSGDRSQIKQVFVNIAKNALEAMGEEGCLTVSVITRPSSVEIVFEDEGPGIDPDKTARIFEPFYTTKESGVGMGLAICQRIVTAHDGVIRVGSRAGGGTTMTVRLPLAPAGASPG